MQTRNPALEVRKEKAFTVTVIFPLVLWLMGWKVIQTLQNTRSQIYLHQGCQQKVKLPVAREPRHRTHQNTIENSDWDLWPESPGIPEYNRAQCWDLGARNDDVTMLSMYIWVNRRRSCSSQIPERVSWTTAQMGKMTLGHLPSFFWNQWAGEPGAWWWFG